MPATLEKKKLHQKGRRKYSNNLDTESTSKGAKHFMYIRSYPYNSPVRWVLSSRRRPPYCQGASATAAFAGWLVSLWLL